MSTRVLVLPIGPLEDNLKDYDLAQCMVDAGIRAGGIMAGEREEYMAAILAALHLRHVRKGERKLI